MRGIKAGLLMLGKSRAVEVVDAITEQLRRVMQPGGMPLSGAYLDRLADAVVSLEYYIETLQAGRSDPWYMLDNAQACLEVLQREPEQVVPTVPAVSPANYARTVRIAPPHRACPVAERHRPGEHRAIRSRPPVLTARAAPQRFGRRSGTAEPVRRGSARGAWRRFAATIRPGTRIRSAAEALGTVRRSFHTLKGSGRMVGARELSEFSWAMENLVNRLLDGTLARSPEILSTLREAVALLPQLVAELGEWHHAAHPARAPGGARARAGRRARSARRARGAAAPEAQRGEPAARLPEPAPERGAASRGPSGRPPN